MSARNITVNTAKEVLYLTGTVNGEECTWQMVGAGIWQTTAARAANDIYTISLQAVTAEGRTYTLETTVYYGLNLILDRTRADVEEIRLLVARGWDKLTVEEQAAWLNGSYKGAYNYTDLNRVGAAVNYVAELLCEWGYPYRPNVRTNWRADELFYAEDLREYLAAVEGLRDRLTALATTPEVPGKLNHWQEANDLEQIIFDVHLLVQNMILGLPWADTIYCGAYPI